MISFEVWLLIVGFAIPMVISPGPGNTLLVSSGARFGVKGTISFLIGFEIANVLLCVLYGLGLSQILLTHPLMSELLKWAGVLYTLYLAYGFFRSSSLAELSQLKPLRVIDGLVSVATNPKIHSMILVMFSQFLNPHHSLWGQVVQITIVFFVISIVCHLMWVYGGALLFSRVKSQKSLRVQGYLFGTCMVLVAAFVAFS